jgi:hypothetical protein
MARMIPDLDPSEIANTSERLAYSLFRDQLPDDWVVIFNYKFCLKVDFQLRDGQVDFILIAPKKGVLFVEVKGSYALRLDCNNEERGFRVSKDGSEVKLSKTPFTQVDEHKHNVVRKILCERLGALEFPGIYGHAVFYPKGKLVDTPPSQATQVFWGYADKDNLHQKAIAAFRNVRPLSYGEQRFDSQNMAKVVDVFEDHSFVPVAQAAESDDYNSQIEKLTKNQFNTVQGLLFANLNKVRVEGPAGSGKTMLALWTASHFAASGMRTLYLCKNKALVTWIKLNQPEDLFDVNTFAALCPKLDQNWGRRNKKEEAFWDEIVPIIIADAAAALPINEKYDAIIIDEGQDFHPHWFIPIEALLKDEREGKLYIFYDPEQKVQFEGELRFPDADIEYPLIANCRNPEKITDYCGNVIAKQLQTMQGMPTGNHPEILGENPNANERAKICSTIIKKWHSEGFKPSRIAVLSPYNSKNENSTLYYLRQQTILNLNFSDDVEAWLNDRAFWISTIKSFKGLEADCVILTDIPTPNDFFLENELYVGTSRATHQVIIIPCDTQAKIKAQNHLGSNRSFN